MRTSHRTQAEEVLARAVEEEVRRSGGRTDGQVLLSRARGELDALLRTADEEYAAYEAAVAAAEAERQSFGQRYAREGAGTPLLVAGVAAAAACAADLAFGTGASTALGAGAVVGVAGAAATVVKVGAVHWAYRAPAGGGPGPAGRARAVAAGLADGAGGTRGAAVPGAAADARGAGGAAGSRPVAMPGRCWGGPTRARWPGGVRCCSGRSSGCRRRRGRSRAAGS